MYIRNYFGQYAEDVKKLNTYQKILLSANILHFQSVFIEIFDNTYGEELYMLYEEVINELALISRVETPSSSLIKLRDVSYKRIPDTDVFPSKEGTFAQYAMISACYFMSFAIEHDVDAFYKATDIFIESLYAQNQCSDEPLNDTEIYEKIVGRWPHLIEGLS